MFRRRRFEASHQRPSRLWSILRPIALALVLVGTPSAIAVWTLTSPRFALRDIEIESGERVASEWVARSLEPLRGRHVLLLSLSEVEHLLAGHRWVEGVQVHKKLPNALVVQVLERVPVAVLRHGQGLSYVDRQGRLIDRLDGTEAPGALLLVEGRAEDRSAVAAAVAAVEELAAGDSTLFQVVLTVQILTGPDLELEVAALPFAVLVRADRLQPAVAQFERLLPKILDRYEGLEAVDLRFSRQIVMKFPEA
jgi:cell division protein FtsQ